MVAPIPSARSGQPNPRKVAWIASQKQAEYGSIGQVAGSRYKVRDRRTNHKYYSSPQICSQMDYTCPSQLLPRGGLRRRSGFLLWWILILGWALIAHLRDRAVRIDGFVVHCPGFAIRLVVSVELLPVKVGLDRTIEMSIKRWWIPTSTNLHLSLVESSKIVREVFFEATGYEGPCSILPCKLVIRW